jgi:hypothetical protein
LSRQAAARAGGILPFYLIARFVGLKEAAEVAKVYMLQWHDSRQQPFASLIDFWHTADAVISKCQKWSATHYAPSLQ